VKPQAELNNYLQRILIASAYAVIVRQGSFLHFDSAQSPMVAQVDRDKQDVLLKNIHLTRQNIQIKETKQNIPAKQIVFTYFHRLMLHKAKMSSLIIPEEKRIETRTLRPRDRLNS